MRIPFLSFLMLTLCGCQQVKVVDEHGQPLAGAKVFSQAPSLEKGPNLTDGDGVASIPFLPGQFMLRIEFPGYETLFISTKTKIPVPITMKKSSL